MLFRPSYCANCGERIEREEWHLWTSRRFCPVCETEFKGIDLLPRVIAGGSVLAFLIGVGTCLRGGSGQGEQTVFRQPKPGNERPTGLPVGKTAEPAPSVSVTNENAVPQANKVSNTMPPNARTLAALPAAKPGVTERDAASEALYYCGAQTKKGTPCTRRVKGYTRCYQHTGMPAMLPPDKLRVG